MNKKYWLRGGIVGFVIIFIVLLLAALSPVHCIGLSADGTGCISPKGLEAFLYNVDVMNDPRTLGVIGLAVVVGALLGWSYGKIKNKKI